MKGERHSLSGVFDIHRDGRDVQLRMNRRFVIPRRVSPGEADWRVAGMKDELDGSAATMKLTYLANVR